ncbi:hypothetical protein L1887_57804 [Cichorium endivia]|nr:hypothetical protein L1887_57804 [Cichorium endivia]
MEEFLAMTNVADILSVGEKCFNDELYEAAKLLFTSVSNYARLATTLVYLGDYQGSVDARSQGGQHERVEAGACGVPEQARVQAVPDRRSGHHPARRGAAGPHQGALGLERAHMGVFTQTGVALAKYRPERLMEHLKLYWSRSNLPQLIKVAEQCHLWSELVYLYTKYDEMDNAALATMEHAADAWDHDQFKAVLPKVANVEIYYRALTFYLEQHPLLLNDLLTVLAKRIDHGRVVRMFKKKDNDNVPLVRSYLMSVQHHNLEAVNDAYNDLLIEEEDYETLRSSIDGFDNFDAISLAGRLESTSCSSSVGWRRTYGCDERGREEVAEELLGYFVDIGNKRVLCGDAVCVLRPDQAGCGDGAVLETWAGRLYHALPAADDARPEHAAAPAGKGGARTRQEGLGQGEARGGCAESLGPAGWVHPSSSPPVPRAWPARV